jgi:hypothetical protein
MYKNIIAFKAKNKSKQGSEKLRKKKMLTGTIFQRQ